MELGFIRENLKIWKLVTKEPAWALKYCISHPRCNMKAKQGRHTSAACVQGARLINNNQWLLCHSKEDLELGPLDHKQYIRLNQKTIALGESIQEEFLWIFWVVYYSVRI